MTTSEYLKSSESNNFFFLQVLASSKENRWQWTLPVQSPRYAKELDIPYVFKGSYRKANRSRLDSFTGIGDIHALEILKKYVKLSTFLSLPTYTPPQEANMAAPYVDILQIPAFLCRQTDLLIAAAHTGRFVNIKKDSFFPRVNGFLPYRKYAMPAMIR